MANLGIGISWFTIKAVLGNNLQRDLVEYIVETTDLDAKVACYSGLSAVLQAILDVG